MLRQLHKNLIIVACVAAGATLLSATALAARGQGTLIKQAPGKLGAGGQRLLIPKITAPHTLRPVRGGQLYAPADPRIVDQIMSRRALKKEGSDTRAIIQDAVAGALKAPKSSKVVIHTRTGVNDAKDPVTGRYMLIGQARPVKITLTKFGDKWEVTTVGIPKRPNPGVPLPMATPAFPGM